MHDSKEVRLLRISEKISEEFKEGLDYETVNLLSFSIALAEDGQLKNALLAEDESKGYQILSSIAKRFKKYTHLKSLHIQVLSPDFFIFARSWNEGYEGMPIWWFRKDLERLITNQEPKVGVETGRLLTFKSTVPIRSGEKVIGYLEVIEILDEFALNLRQKGIELFALMEDKHLANAALMKDFPQMHGHVLANQNANQQFLNTLEMLNWEKLESRHYLYEEGFLYLYEPMYNGKQEKIGVYLLAISDETLQRYDKGREGFSFFSQFSDEDIIKVVEAWNAPHGSFANASDKSLIELLPKLAEKDKLNLKEEAKKRLRNYSKDALIDIIISDKYRENKRGKIQ